LYYSPSSLYEERCSFCVREAQPFLAAALLLLSGLQKSYERPSMFRMNAGVQKACVMLYDVADGESIFDVARRL